MSDTQLNPSPAAGAGTSNEEQWLKSNYRLAAERYAEAVHDRMRQRVTATAAEYQKLTDLMERAHLECERARIAVEKLGRKLSHDEASAKRIDRAGGIWSANWPWP